MYKAKSDVIRHDDLVEDGALRDFFLLELKEVAAYAPVVDAAIKKMAGGIEQTLKGLKVEGSTIVDIKKINDETKKANDLYLLSAKVKKAEAQANTELERQRKAKAQADKAEIETNKKKADSIKKEKDAYGQLSAELSKLKREAKNLGAEMIALEKAGKKDTDQFRALASQYIIAKNNAAALDKKVKDLDSTVGDNQRNVGNYKQSIKDAANELGLFGGETQKVANIFKIWIQALRTSKAETEANAFATDAAAVASSKWGKAIKAVGTSFKAIGITALIGILGSIAASFKTTETGIVKFEAVMNSLGSIIKVFIGRLGQFGSGLVDYFPALFKDISNGAINAKNKIAEFFGATKQAELSTNNTAEALEKMKHAFDGVSDAIKKTVDLEFELAALRRQNRKDNLKDAELIRKYASEVEILNQIADDQTLSFQEREDAANKSLEASKKSTEAEIRQRRRAVAEAQKELDIRKLQNEDTLDAQEKLAEALDALDDAETKKDIQRLQGEQRRRTIRIKQLTNQIQLIEQTFDKEKELRDKDIADAEKTFKQRQQLIDDLDALSKEKYEKEVSRVSDAVGKRIDANELMMISDEEALAAKIKSFKLGDKAEDLLLKAITNRKAEIKGIVDQNKDLNKSVIEDLKKQKEAENDLRNEKIRGLQITLDNELKAAGKNIALQKEILAKTSQLKRDKLKADAEFEKKKVTDDKTLSYELQAKKILVIDEKLKNDLLENEYDYNDKLKVLRKEQLKQALAVANQITDGIADGLNKRSEIEQQADQRDIDIRKRTIEIQTQLAAQGQDNVLAESLAAADRAEEKKLADAKRAQEQQANIELTKIFFNALDKAMEKDGNPILAFGEALGEVGLAKTIISRLLSGGFYEGTESLSADGKNVVRLPGEGKDNLLIRAHEGERIMGVEDSKAIAGLSNKEVKDAALMYMNNDFERLYIPNYNAANTTTTVIKQDNGLAALANVFAQKIDSLERTIENKPVQQITLGSRMGEYEEQIQRKGITIIKAHTRKRTSLR